MRISDWSSDVCSSDLVDKDGIGGAIEGHRQKGPSFGATGSILQARPADHNAARLRVFGAISTTRSSRAGRRPAYRGQKRSEEHTSELQSLMRTSYAVFCLKKKTTQNTNNKTQTTNKYT